uniref:DNA-directed RNA polymerase RBP11-like dimerisation domain-containing protein n=1 Tax=Phytophthora ramorum TaxID=164328 RepID=H3G821_PHYRM
EDHTLGNALRYVLMRKCPDVDFCGYTIPRPSEPKMHVHLQTHQGILSFDTI